jgi:hypothetical protein
VTIQTCFLIHELIVSQAWHPAVVNILQSQCNYKSEDNYTLRLIIDRDIVDPSTNINCLSKDQPPRLFQLPTPQATVCTVLIFFPLSCSKERYNTAQSLYLKQSHCNELNHIYLSRTTRAVSELRRLRYCSFSATQKYCPQTRRWFLLQTRHMRMRKISWRMTSYYYPSWKHSHNALAHYTLLETPDVFSMCVCSVRTVCRSYQ